MEEEKYKQLVVLYDGDSFYYDMIPFFVAVKEGDMVEDDAGYHYKIVYIFVEEPDSDLVSMVNAMAHLVHIKEVYHREILSGASD